MAPTYTGPTLAQLRTMVEGLVRRPLAASNAEAATLLDLFLNEALRVVQDSYNGWRVMQATVTAYDDGTALQTTAASRLVDIPARYKDGARLYYLDGNSRVAIPSTVGGKAITMEWIWEQHPDPTVQSATPVAGCIQGEYFQIVPTPSVAISLSMDGRFYLEDLVATTDRNWFTMHCTLPLVQIAAAEAYMTALGEPDEGQRLLELARVKLSERIGTELTELVRRSPRVVGQEPE